MHYGYGAVECTTLLRPMLNAYDILRSTPSRYIIGVNSTHGPVIGCEALSYYTKKKGLVMPRCTLKECGTTTLPL